MVECAKTAPGTTDELTACLARLGGELELLDRNGAPAEIGARIQEAMDHLARYLLPD